MMNRLSSQAGRLERERAQAFVAREWYDGDQAAYQRAQEFAWQVEERRRARRAQRVSTLFSLPLPVLGCGALLAVVGLVAAWLWITSNIVHAAVIGAGITAATYFGRRARKRHPAPSEMVAPPYRAALQNGPLVAGNLGTLGSVMPGDVRAIVDALPGAAQRKFLQARELGVLPSASRTAHAGFERVESPLPSGVLARDVNMERFAGALGLPSGQVRRGPDVPGRVVFDVLDVNPDDMPVPAWPALGQPTSWADPLPLGVDATGAPVSVALHGRRVLVGGMSGAGKSWTMRLIALWAAASPDVDCTLIDLKGGPVFREFRGRVEFFHAGAPTDAVVNHLQGIRDEMQRRYDVMSAGGDEVFRPVSIVIDEVHLLWTLKGAEDVVEDLARRGREAGIGVVLGTQAPDKASVPTRISGQADVRIGMRLPDAWAVGMILGEHALPCGDLPDGHAYMAAGRGPARLAFYPVSDADAAQHLRALPALPAAPARPAIEPVEDDLRARCAAVIGDRPGMRWDDLADELDMDEDDLRAALREHYGIRSGTYRHNGATVRGVPRGAVMGA